MRIKMKILLSGLLLMIPNLVLAKITVTQVKDVRALISFEDEVIKVGAILQMKDQTGAVVAAKVTKVSAHQAILQLAQGMTVKKGDVLELYLQAPPAEGEQAPAEPAAAPVASSQFDDRAWQFGGGLYYALPSTVTFSSISVTGVSYSQMANLDYSGVFGFEIEARKNPRHSWGVQGGLSYELASSLTSGTVWGGGFSTYLSSGSPSQIQTTLIYANASYRWDGLYLPFGLNYSLINYTAPSGYQGSVSANGGIGAQLGLGYVFLDHWAVEVYDRVVSFTLSANQSGITTNDGTGYDQTYLLVGKYFF